ncbi:hypothetical protein G6O67_002844 [Ophiocordyceps sinensis]|uniref:DNA polymerase n=1 Tax=Ophiocordyceps sinensis TaxID=72228 RepID=A0A8H4PV34_9HYPO|nr:hypothetical protein G6O67_002844 [Ophiocordyceps sinensis]
MSWKPDVEVQSDLRFAEADSGVVARRSISPPDGTEFSQSRRAAVFGVNIGGGCESGACKRYSRLDLCTLSYDIETSMEDARKGGFALIDADILSIAAKCSCGSEFYTFASEGKRSPELVSEFILFVSDHSPLWLIGWNCYTFDNECMRFHCEDSLKDIFMVSRIGAFGKPSYGSIVNIPGTYNVDLLVYMNKALYKLPSFKLGDVAKSMNVTGKLKMPDLRGNVNQEQLRVYNMNDCVVTLDIWIKEDLEHVIPSIAVCTTSPVYDCSRYVTGTIASLGYSSHAMSMGLGIYWGECTIPQLYKGGYVMDPVRGVHKDIIVCDFSSMYPSIMASCNINPHEFQVEKTPHGIAVGSVEVSERTTKVWLENRIVTFDNSKPSIMCSFMRYLVTERSAVKKTLPMLALSMKVLANSVYGSIGYDKSHLYSPSCAAAVTAVGRHCISTAASFFKSAGLVVLYGDTDSCMVTGAGSREETERVVKVALEKLHRHMTSNTLHMMRMEIEEYYKKGIMIDKKRYCMLREDGTMKNVGISLVRRDVSALCKEAASVSVQAVFLDSRQSTIDSIARFVMAVSQMAVEKSLTLSDVSKYVKRDGQSGYEFPGVEGKPSFIPEDEADLASVVQYDTDKVLKAVSSEIERFTVPCRIGRVSNILRESSIDSWLY